MKIYQNQLPSQLAQGLSPCYLIVGDEPLGIKEACDSIRQKAKQVGFGEREVLVVDGHFNWQTLFASMGSLSLFAEKKIIELSMPTGKPGTAGSKAIIDFIENIPTDICLLIYCEQWNLANEKTKWVKTIIAQGTYMRVFLPKGHEFNQWIRNRCRQLGLMVDTDGISLLSMRLEGNLLAAAQELEKLKMRFAKQQISAQDIAGLVADNARFDVFRLTDALLENNLYRVIKMTRALKKNNIAIVIIHWALERQVRMLLHFAYIKAKSHNITAADYRTQGVWQNQQDMLQTALGRFTVKQLEHLLAGMARLDRVIKGQASGNAWLDLEQWMVEFCG